MDGKNKKRKIHLNNINKKQQTTLQRYVSQRSLSKFERNNPNEEKEKKQKKFLKQQQNNLNIDIKRQKIDKEQQNRNNKDKKLKEMIKRLEQQQRKEKIILPRQSRIIRIKSKQFQQQKLYNVQFYQNNRISLPSGDYIDIILKKWCKNYQLLEKHHGYIQWIFPNLFQSRFNIHSHPLNNSEILLFKTKSIIYNRYVKSYQMMLEFYGMKLKNKQTGQIVNTRFPDHKQRYIKTLLTSFHNHMRITRILCSLIQIGFGRWAKQLVLFLKKQIYQGGLKSLLKYNVYNDWKQFANYQESKDEINHYFKKFNKNKKNIKIQDQSKL